MSRSASPRVLVLGFGVQALVLSNLVVVQNFWSGQLRRIFAGQDYLSLMMKLAAVVLLGVTEIFFSHVRGSVKIGR
jgi:hypothetical protein